MVDPLQPLLVRIAALERKVSDLYRRIGQAELEVGTGVDEFGKPTEAAAFDAEVLGLLQQGKKIQAIKMYRERTGLGLKEAKTAIDRLEAEQAIG